MVDYTEGGIEPAPCGFPKQVWKQAFKFPAMPSAMDYGIYAWCGLQGGSASALAIHRQPPSFSLHLARRFAVTRDSCLSPGGKYGSKTAHQFGSA